MIKLFFRICWFFLIFIAYGQQGNYKYNQYGNRSILLTGNVTGSVTDIGLTYYNPARLSLIENNGFAFNARAFQYNQLNIDPLITDGDPVNRGTFTGVPSLLGGTFSLFDQRFAYVFLAKYRVNRDISSTYSQLNDRILDEFPDAEAYLLKTSVGNDIRDDWYGLSWANKLNDDLSIGISLFGSYYKYRGIRSYSQDFQFTTEQVSSEQFQYSFDQRSYGFHVKIGADYRFEKVDIGININLPYLEVASSGSYGLSLVKAGTQDNSDLLFDFESENIKARRRIPYGISAGAGIKLGRSRLHLNLDFMSSLSEYSRLDIPQLEINGQPTDVIFNEKRRFVTNFGVGGELYIEENFSALFGFSTDFDSLGGETNYFDLVTTNADELSAGTNYIHLSGGVDWKFKWASLIFGLTYTRGTNSISISDNDFIEPPNTGVADNSKITSSRIQFVIGFEIPFIKGMSSTNNNRVNIN
ncbi:hypothetical protein [Winogradskyella aurantiaca]|uniref:hypothetical protein n=1 Tax=Winogradskyella aurantiaca TaxID=2219558 RepID=UPI000E1CAE4B|nr:hypothetical protein [Winogradskyella aurantiaca]